MGERIRKVYISIAIVFLVVFSGSSSIFAAGDLSNEDIIEYSSTCLDCHEEHEASLTNSAHALTNDESIESPILIGCISCHDDWAVHVDDPSTENISSVSDSFQLRQAEICGDCHLTLHQSAMVTTDPHSRSGLKCTSCHTVHNNRNVKLVKSDDGNYCVACHPNVTAEFRLRSVHPLESHNIRCVDCHDISGIKDMTLAVGLDWTCQNCHSDQSGPFRFEHPATYSHMVEGGGCSECHMPHGSTNVRLLKQPGNGVCIQCHGVPPGHIINHGGWGAKSACVVCHTDIHGSYNNGKFLDLAMNDRFFADCYQSGCHIFED
jgi:DmsE family decaheme c-type cytochrome